MKKVAVVILTLVLVAGITGAVIFKTQYVVLDKVYKKDVDTLLISDVTDDYIEKMYRLKNLSVLDILNSEINSSNLNNLLKLPKLNELDFVNSDIDFAGAESGSPKTVNLCLSKISNFKDLANCSSLVELKISAITANNMFITEEKEFPKKDYILADSSDFAIFDQIEKLSIWNTKIEDISGLTEMDSLKTLKVTTGFISEEYTKELEEKGITVIEENYTDDSE